ncbi:MAG: hypothetical protein ACOVKB_08615, partial [Silanimonas sp.]
MLTLLAVVAAGGGAPSDLGWAGVAVAGLPSRRGAASAPGGVAVAVVVGVATRAVWFTGAL